MSPAAPDRIRPIAIALIRDAAGRLLVTSTDDPVTGRTFVRPPGGGIEPGELAIDTIVRELDEELGLAVESPRLLGVIEHVFDFAGHTLHEHVFVLAVEAAADAVLPSVTDAGHPVWWLAVDRFQDPALDLVPAGLLRYVESHPH